MDAAKITETVVRNAKIRATLGKWELTSEGGDTFELRYGLAVLGDMVKKEEVDGKTLVPAPIPAKDLAELAELVARMKDELPQCGGE